MVVFAEELLEDDVPELELFAELLEPLEPLEPESEDLLDGLVDSDDEPVELEPLSEDRESVR